MCHHRSAPKPTLVNSLNWTGTVAADHEVRTSTGFYAYIKEVRRFRALVEPDPPLNFRWVYSWGGREDHLLDPARDRTADVFPDADRPCPNSAPTQRAWPISPGQHVRGTPTLTCAFASPVTRSPSPRTAFGPKWHSGASPP
nr:hypothetical protein [Streptomyces fradiae]